MDTIHYNSGTSDPDHSPRRPSDGSQQECSKAASAAGREQGARAGFYMQGPFYCILLFTQPPVKETKQICPHHKGSCPPSQLGGRGGLAYGLRC